MAFAMVALGLATQAACEDGSPRGTDSASDMTTTSSGSTAEMESSSMITDGTCGYTGGEMGQSVPPYCSGGGETDSASTGGDSDGG